MTMDAASYRPPEGLKFPQPPGEATPDWVDVRQQDQAIMKPVPVRIDGFTPVWELPAKRSIFRSFSVPVFSTPAQPIEVIPADPRIKDVWIVADTANPGHMYLGTHEQLSTLYGSGSCDGLFLAGGFAIGPLQGFSDTPIYAVAITSGGSANTLSVHISYWAD